MQKIKAILYAILAAVLYSLMTPVAKLMQVSVSPVAEAGLLYLGAGIGMTVIYITRLSAKDTNGVMKPEVGLPLNLLS